MISRISLPHFITGLLSLTINSVQSHPIKPTIFNSSSELDQLYSKKIFVRPKRITVSSFMNMKGGGFDNATHVENFLSNQKTKEFLGTLVAGGIAGAPGGPAGVSLGAIAGAIGYGISNIPSSNGTG